MVNPFETIDARLSNIEALLLDLFSSRFSQGPNDTAAEKLMTVREAAELLTLAVPTIYALVQRRGIPFSRRGKRLYFSKSELTQWVQAGRIKTACEVVAEAETELATAGRRGGAK